MKLNHWKCAIWNWASCEYSFKINAKRSVRIGVDGKKKLCCRPLGLLIELTGTLLFVVYIVKTIEADKICDWKVKKNRNESILNWKNSLTLSIILSFTQKTSIHPLHYPPILFDVNLRLLRITKIVQNWTRKRHQNLDRKLHQKVAF